MLVRDLLGYYLAHCRARRLDAVESQLRPVVRLLGALEAESVTGRELAEYRAARLAEGVTDSTVNRALCLLRAAYRMAMADEIVTRMPRIRLVREAAPRDRFVTIEELGRLLVELPDRLRDPVAWLFWSGWRKRAVLGLRWSDVDLSRGAVRLSGACTKNGHPVVAPLAGPLAEVIGRRIEARIDGCPLIFHHDGGRPIGDFKRAWRTACRRAGLGGLRVHDLRRSMARLHLEQGIRKEVTMALGGWRSESVYRGYLGLRDRDLADAVTKAAMGATMGRSEGRKRGS